MISIYSSINKIHWRITENYWRIIFQTSRLLFLKAGRMFFRCIFVRSYRKTKIIPHSLIFSCNALKYSMLIGDGRVFNSHQTLTFCVIPHHFRVVFYQIVSNSTVLLLKTN